MANTKNGVPTEAASSTPAGDPSADALAANAQSAATSTGAETATGSGPVTEGGPAAAAVAANGERISAPEEIQGEVWTEAPAVTVTPEQSEEQAKAAKIAAEDEALRIANPDRVVYRAPVEGIGGQSFEVGQIESEADADDAETEK